MILRLLYMILGVMLGAVWMSLSPLSLDYARNAVQLASNKLHAVGVADEAALLTAGYNQPRKIFLDERLLSVPLNWSWNYLSDSPGYGNASWLNYGAVGDEEEFFTIAYVEPSKLGFRTGGIRSEIASQHIFKNNNIRLKFVGKNRSVETEMGTLSVVTFGYRENGLAKICNGFLSASTDAGYQLKGQLCGKTGDIPSDAKLVCLVNSLKVYDRAYWDEPQTDKDARPTCDYSQPEKQSRPASKTETSASPSAASQSKPPI